MAVEVTEKAQYDASPFAARAAETAKRMGLALAALGFALAALAAWTRSPLIGAVAFYQFVAGHGVFRRRLWGVALLALEVACALLGAPLALTGYAGISRADALAWALPPLALALVALPGVIRLLRDAERQYTVGRWT